MFSLLRRDVLSAHTDWGLSVSPSCATQLSHTAMLTLSWHPGTLCLLPTIICPFVCVCVLHICQSLCSHMIRMEMSRFRVNSLFTPSPASPKQLTIMLASSCPSMVLCLLITTLYMMKVFFSGSLDWLPSGSQSRQICSPDRCSHHPGPGG